MKKTLLIAALCASTGLLAHANTILVNENFSDGDRSTQNPPSSLQWYSTFTSNLLTVEDGWLVNSSPQRVRGAAAYFTDLGSAATINVGETINLSLNMRVDTLVLGSAANMFSIGLFDSLGIASNRSTADNQNANVTSTGYAGGVSLNSALRETVNLAKRVGTGTGTLPLITNRNAYAGTAAVATSAAYNEHVTQNIVYDVLLSVARTSDTEALVTFTLSGGDLTEAQTITYTDSSGYFSFDTIGFYTSQNSNDPFMGLGQISLDNIKVEIVIPEASASAVLLAGIAVLTAVRRRRKAA